MTYAILLAAILLCVFLSGFFSGSEMAYSSCNRLRLEGEREDGSRAAKLALYIVDHFDDALGAILIGNNLVNVASSSLMSVLMILFLGQNNPQLDTWNTAATVTLTIIIIIFGETIPKITAKKTPNRLALRYAWPVRILMTVLRPVVFLVVGLVNLLTGRLPEQESGDSGEKVEELQSIIETAEDEEVLDEEESELVQAAIAFRDISASEAMTARVDVLAIDIEDSWDEILDVLRKSHYTRIPVYEESIDNVIGVLHMNRFLKELSRETAPEKDLRSMLMRPCYVYKTMKLPEVLNTFRKEKQHLAIVVDEYGGTQGIISLEDVLEQVVGDIWDETDTVEEDLVQRTEREYEIDGDMPISDFLDLVEIREENFEFESETVGGWTIEYHGTFPDVGTTFHYDHFQVTVLAMDSHRVERVLIVLDPPEETEEKSRKSEEKPRKSEEKPRKSEEKSRKPEEKNRKPAGGSEK